MKQLFNYCSVPGCEAELRFDGMTLGQYISSLGLDGVELLVYRSEPYMRSYEKETLGVHLRTWNTWYDFWTGNKKRLAEIFATEEEMAAYYGGLKKRNWLLEIKHNIQAALMENPEYLVFHVGEATPEEQFSWKFAHSDMQVAKMAARVFNRVSKEIPDNVLVLFENTWWPGLRLTDPEVVETFLYNVHRDNIGLTLNTGHLMNTNPSLRTEKEAIEFICDTIKNLGSLTRYIKGIHLSCSLPGEYLDNAPKHMPEGIDEAGRLAHICAMDQHRPFTDPSVKKIVNMLGAKYLVYELFYDDFGKLAKDIATQKEFLGY